MVQTSNRRRHPRYPIELDALMSPVDGPAEACTVHDFCEGGLLVRRAHGDASALASGEVVRIRAKLAAADGVHPIAMAGKVVWAHEDYFGLVFERPSPHLCQRLQRHRSGADPRAPLRSVESGSSEARARARLRQVAKRLLPMLLRDLLLVANERLLDHADRVVSNTEQAQLFADMNALDALRKGDRLVSAVLDQSEVHGDPSAEVADSGELTLVDPDEFERWLEASRTATSLERRFGGLLSALGSRLAALRGDDASPVLQTPFEPQHFTNAITSIASDLALGATTRSVLFDAVGQVLTERLADFYAELNRTLDALGAPAAQRRSMRVVKAGASGTVSGTADTSPATPPDTGVPTVETAEESVSEGTAGPVRGDAVAAGYVPIDPALLAQAQARLGEQRAGLAVDLLSQVKNLPDMTDSLQGWLGLLGGPLQQEALADPEVFYQPQHPLREIIDALGHLQMFRPAPDGPPESDETRQQVNELLQPLAQGASDAATVRSIAQRLGELTAEQSRRYQHNVERVVEASDGRERVRLARVRVVAALNERYAAREVPEVLQDLLETGWRSVLELAALREREGDETFARRLQTIDVLVAKLGGQACESKATDMSTEVLLDEVTTELASAAFDPFRVDAVGKRLRTELSGTAAAVRRVRFAPLAAEDDPAGGLDVPVGISPAVWPGILASCEDVCVGDRLRFAQRAEHKPNELRVAWIRADGGLFTLVDYRGLRVRDIGRPALALGLYRREIQLERVDGKPLSERAVDTLLSRMEQRLAHQATHDSLTGLINRNQFTAALEQALRRPDGGHSALLWIDIDQFRLVNDMHGFETGDGLLVAVARLLEQTCGGQVLAHVGADRFAVFYPDVSADDALQYAEHLREKVVSMPFSVAGQALSASISVGMVASDPQQGAVGTLLQAADDALSAAKGSGGNQVYRYDPADPQIQRHRESVRWVARVDEALEHGQLNLRCQPIVPVLPDAGLTPHYEVLLGVSSGSREALPIAEFIDAAERYDRMRSVDRWVTRTVIEWIGANRAAMPSVHGLAVNLSGQTASDPAFIDFVRQQFQRTAIDPSWLSFEVTETAAVADLSASAGILQDLKRLGCRVALDDFGSGLASYSYLKELPIDWLKIDGVFVRKIATESSDFAVVKSINDIGHFLGKQTIAEYVADEKILRLVAEIGVDYAQGYAISPPGLLDDLLKPLPQATAGQRA